MIHTDDNKLLAFVAFLGQLRRIFLRRATYSTYSYVEINGTKSKEALIRRQYGGWFRNT
jgi:hypothetical protein